MSVASDIPVLSGRAAAPVSRLTRARQLSLGLAVLLACVAVLLGRSLMAARPPRFAGQLVLVALGFAFWLSTFALYRPDLQRMLQIQVNNFNQGNYWTINLPRETSRAIVQRSVDLGIYKPPARPLPRPDVAEKARKGGAPPKFRQIER